MLERFGKLLAGSVAAIWVTIYVSHFHGRFQLYEFVPLFVVSLAFCALTSAVVAWRRPELTWLNFLATVLLANAMMFALYYLL